MVKFGGRGADQREHGLEADQRDGDARGRERRRAFTGVT
jgi:hypothetical protein